MNKRLTLRPSARQSFQDFLLFSQASWPIAARSDRHLITIARILATGGTMLLLIDDLPTGFWTIQRASQVFPTIMWEHITYIGDALVVIPLMLFLAFRSPHLLLALIITIVVGALITHTLKPWLDTPRPALVFPLDTFQIIGKSIKYQSMPSGHTLTAFAAAGLLTRVAGHNLWRIVLILAAAIIGWSRVAVGAHWPADVMFGAAAGLFSAWIGLKLCDCWYTRFPGWGFAAVLILLILCALALLGHDGGLPNTQIFSLLVGICTLSYSGYQLHQHRLLPFSITVSITQE